MTISNKARGAHEEKNAVHYLENLGYKILATNWQWSNKGELDIVAIDPNRFGNKYIVFVEVKYRSWSREAALKAVDHKKLTQLKKLAQIYLIRNNLDLNKTRVSFDLIAINGSRLDHVKDII